jgi:tetratricopeptide (TPR) repeat protein
VKPRAELGLLLAGALLVLSGCSEAAPSVAPSGPSASEPSEAAVLPPSVTRRTTSGHIALGNLHAQIAAAEAALQAQPGALAVHAARLLDLYATRTRFSGSYSDFARMQTLAEQLVSQHPAAESYAARAAVRATLHEFGLAETDLTHAQELGSASAAAALASLAVATGVASTAALADDAARAAAHPSFATLSALATAEAALGQFERADQHYLEAARHYRDASPFALAWLAFSRGVMWAEAADRPELAFGLYQEAVERLPGYIVANVHLAEVEAERGDVEGAIERLTRLASDTEDPEPAGLLAELLLERDPAASAAYGAHARARYDALLAEHRLAFADHAAEFFMGPIGADPARAVELALDNLANRSTARAHLVALKAATVAGDRELVCRISLAAAPLAERGVKLVELLDEARCR